MRKMETTAEKITKEIKKHFTEDEITQSVSIWKKIQRPAMKEMHIKTNMRCYFSSIKVPRFFFKAKILGTGKCLAKWSLWNVRINIHLLEVSWAVSMTRKSCSYSFSQDSCSWKHSYVLSINGNLIIYIWEAQSRLVHSPPSQLPCSIFRPIINNQF